MVNNNNIWLVVELALWKMMDESSVGMMTISQYEWKNDPNVPNHQPVIIVS